MEQARVRRLFPGGNTPQGFYSYYNYIIPASATRIFILKGGPGTGKSTFMRKMGEAMVANGYDAEYHHCSSDNNSLDGLVIPALQVAFIDGTAPHIVDPKNPGCVDEIIYLGEFWNESGMIKNKAQILECNAEIGNNFQRAYRLLRAAKALYEDWEAINTRALRFALANQKAETLSQEIFAGVSTTGAGQVRKLFASAITPNGPVHYLESSVWPQKRCYVITGEPGSGKSTILQKVIALAQTKGLDVEAFYCPLDPEKPEHVVIPALSVAVTTSAYPHEYSLPTSAATISMDCCLDQDYLAKFALNKKYDQEKFRELFDQSINCIRRSKQLHDDLESYYIPNMDFAGIQKLWEKTLQRVLTYAQK